MHDALLARISGLRVLDHPANSINEFSAAVVLFESRNAMETLGGRTFGAATWTTAVSYQSTALISASSGTAPTLPPTFISGLPRAWRARSHNALDHPVEQINVWIFANDYGNRVY